MTARRDYVGMTGLTPEQRFENHKNGIKAASVVEKYGERLVPKLYEHLNPMSYGAAKAMEVSSPTSFATAASSSSVDTEWPFGPP